MDLDPHIKIKKNQFRKKSKSSKKKKKKKIKKKKHSLITQIFSRL